LILYTQHEGRVDFYFRVLTLLTDSRSWSGELVAISTNISNLIGSANLTLTGLYAFL
jgi:hypothetical protein